MYNNSSLLDPIHSIGLIVSNLFNFINIEIFQFIWNQVFLDKLAQVEKAVAQHFDRVARPRQHLLVVPNRQIQRV